MLSVSGEMESVAKALVSLLFLMFLAGCFASVESLYPPTPGQPHETVYVVNHGGHTGLVFEKDKLSKQAKPPCEQFKGSRYIEVGWGDEGFYQAQRVTSGVALRAVLWPTTTVLHIVGMDRPAQQYFTRSGIIKVDLSKPGFQRLCSFLASSYFRDAQGSVIDLGPGTYDNSRFYKATGKYFFPKTCNVWTAKALRSAGCPITPFCAIGARNVFRQTEKFGTVIRKMSEN